MTEPNLRKELAKAEKEPFLPIEKKLIGWSLGLGFSLLALLALVSRVLPAG
jgi:hypothetical protein